MLIVFSLQRHRQRQHHQQTLGPVEDLASALLRCWSPSSWGRPRRAAAGAAPQRKEAKEAAGEAKKSWPERMLGRGSARVTFAVGVLLTFPGVSYLTALDRIAKLDAARVPTACSCSSSA